MSTYNTQFFPHSQNNTFTNSTLLNVEGNYINPSREGLTTLRHAIATGAFHDSIDRSTIKCHPGTREKLINLILSWIKDPADTRKDILWIHGPTGSGKSTVMQSVAEICFNCAPESENGHPGGTFFFSRGKPGRDGDRCLYTTLSYSLTQCIPAFREKIDAFVVANPLIASKDHALQLQKLIFEPLQQLMLDRCETPFVIIDGLDECNGHHVQRRILELIQTALRDHGPHLRFIITTRSEAHIREIFQLPHFQSITLAIPLDISFDPKNDIRLYLEQSFEEIARVKGYPTRKTPWPQTSDINYLVEKSSGQFLYAATVVKFVGTDLRDPAKQLKIILKPSLPSPSIFANLDALYTQILETIPEKETLLRIFSLLLTMHCSQPPEVYDDILGLEAGDTTFILRGLHSVIRYPTSDDRRERQALERRLEYDKTRGLRFHHASFQEFLLDKDRSGAFFVDISNAPAELVQLGFSIMTKWISSPWRRISDETNYPNKETWGYLKHHMVTHLAECKPEVRTAIVKDLLDIQLSFPPPTPLENDIWDHAFHALHSMVTAFALILDDEGKKQLLSPTNFHSEHSHWAQDCPLKVVPDQQDCSVDVYIKYSDLLDELYKFTLSSTSNDVLRFLDKVPGLVTASSPIVASWLHSLFRIDREEIAVTMRRNGMFFYKWNNAFWNRHFNLSGGGSENPDHEELVLSVNPHFASFLCDRRRACQFFRDPELRNILDYSHIISMIFSSDWLEVPRSRNEVTHLDDILRKCLDAITLSRLSSSPESHPITALINVLKELQYDLSCLQKAPVLNVDLVWSATRRLLDWLHRQHEETAKNYGMTGSERHRLRKMLGEISAGIYNQILQVHSVENGGRLVAISDPFLVAISREFASNTHSVLSPPLTPPRREGELVISETLLSLHGIRSSLLDFLTRPNRAMKMYCSPEIYHTQLAEICLKHCDPSVKNSTRTWDPDWRTLPSYKEWRFHLVRARPSEYILDTLGKIPFGPWLAEGLPTGDSETKEKAILAIIGWVEEVSEGTSHISERWKEILVSFGRLQRWKDCRLPIPKTRIAGFPTREAIS